MTLNVTMIAPTGTTGIIQGGGSASYTIGTDGTVVVPSTLVSTLLNAGFKFFRSSIMSATFLAPLVADLVFVKAAATPANGAIVIAAQPDYPRKLQVYIVIGTTTTTAITAGTLTLVGIDQDGNAITEIISLVENASATVKTANAFASVTSGTVANYAAAGSGTGNTLGIGLAADLGVPTGAGQVDLACIKATKVIHTNTGSGTTVTTVAAVPSDDVASTTTVDAVARTIAPTTAPGATATTQTDFQFLYSFGLAD